MLVINALETEHFVFRRLEDKVKLQHRIVVVR